MPGDGCGECVGQIFIRSCITGSVIFVESQIIPRRATIIRQGRSLQNWLRVPETLRIFSETNPGMTDRDIRIGATAMGTSALPSYFALVVIIDSWPSWAPAFFWLESVSFCIVALAWLKFALARRRRQASRTAKEYGPTAAGEEDLEEAEPPAFTLRDPELAQTINWIWADIWMYA